MKLLFAIILSIIWGNLAMAEVIVARSGEHPSFSRIVLPFSNGVDWEMGRTNYGYEITFGGEHEINVANVFKLIPKRRLSEIQFLPDKSKLVLHLECECYADAFVINNRRLVIDIKDGKPTKQTGFEAPLASDNSEAIKEFNPPVYEAMLPIVGNINLELQSEGGAETLQDDKALTHARSIMLKGMVLPNLTISDPISRADTNLPEPDPALGRRVQEQVKMMQKDLLLQIGKASSQGLLAINNFHTEGTALNPIGTVPSKLINRLASLKRRSVPTALLQTQSARIVSRTSLDVISPNKTAEFNSARNGLHEICVPASSFEISSWGNEADVFGSVGTFRRQLSSEVSGTNVVPIEGLVKAYLYAGFGKEAQHILNMQKGNISQRDILIEIAAILDDENSPKTDFLSLQSQCDNSAAMWAILANPNLLELAETPKRQVLRTFSGLPVHLRRQLGPRLIKAFRQANDLDASKAIRNSIWRAGGSHGDAFNLADAELLVEQGHTREAKTILRKISNGNSVSSTEALLQLVEFQISEKKLVSFELIRSLENLAYEHKGSVREQSIVVALAKSFSQNGNFFNAFDTVISGVDRKALETQIADELYAEILSKASLQKEQSSFLTFYYAYQDLLSELPIPTVLRQKVALRLSENKLPKAALKILETSSARDLTDATILARVANLRGAPKEALRITSGYLNNQEVDRVRRESARLLNDDGIAALELVRLGDQKAEFEALWRGKNYSALANREAGELSEVSAIITLSKEKQSGHPFDVNSLETFQDELELSQTNRSALQQVVQRFQPP